MSISIGPLKLEGRVLLAPMAGVTDAPFRAAVQGFGAGLTYTEMIASRELLRARGKERRRLAQAGSRTPCAVQLAGFDPSDVAEAARIAEGEGAQLIDINFGCPAKLVTGFACGSALMRDPPLTGRLVAALAGAVRVPVTVKMRLGWDEGSINAGEIAAIAEKEGARAITVHGRTRSQFYKGSADWARVGDVRARIRLPLFVNGDIQSADDARAALRLSGADGVMIGRAALGRPWLLAQIEAELNGLAAPADPQPAVIWSIMETHYGAALDHYGVAIGRRMVRKHLAAYAAVLALPQAIRSELLTSDDPMAIARLLERGAGRSLEAA